MRQPRPAARCMRRNEVASSFLGIVVAEINLNVVMC
jgi:hypothetical protein